MAKQFSEDLLRRIGVVTNKRARFVLDRIVEQGAVTTEEISAAGYDHPPRAAQDVRDLGFRIKTLKVKHSNGRSIAAYVIDEDEIEGGKQGRRLLPKKERDALIKLGGNKCVVCGSMTNLQIDHRIPYSVAGESQSEEDNPYQLLCGSCNRKKSWACEHCENLLMQRAIAICEGCYWAQPAKYTHVAMLPERRLDVIWIGDEVRQFEALKSAADEKGHTIAEEIKELLTNMRRDRTDH